MLWHEWRQANPKSIIARVFAELTGGSMSIFASAFLSRHGCLINIAPSLVDEYIHTLRSLTVATAGSDLPGDSSEAQEELGGDH